MYVYLLQSIPYPDRKYIGLTNDLQDRLKNHNHSQNKHTKKYNPWKLKSYIWFEDVTKARKFEKYLKQGSGHAFAKRHLW